MEEVTNTGNAAPLFSAFISYSHADAAVVRKLHRQLEAYRLPEGMGDIAAANAHHGRLGRVFRDREDLSAAQSLSDAVTMALDQSEVFVVVCSPDARQSKWVAQEIAYFREHRPGKPILAAIVRGEPADVFPAALTEGGAEPLAADLRKEGDGWKLGFLKVVAGIAGVPLDTLVQRDSQRQTRRVMAVTGVVAVLAIIMAGMTLFALQARNEAQAHRAEAEGLVEYMITDLRDDLEGVGRLDVMDNVNQRALGYYAAQENLAAMPAESLYRRARVIEVMGRDEETKRNIDAALAYYRELFRTTEEILERDPNNAERILAHAWSDNRIATLRQGLIPIADSESHFSRIAANLRSIATWGREQPRWWKATALTNGNICALGVIAENYSTGVGRSCRQATDAGRTFRTLDQTGEATYDLIYNLFWAASFEANGGDTERAAVLRTEALALSSEQLLRDPSSVKLKRQQMEILGSTIGIGSASDPKDLQRAIALADEVLATEPSNADVRERRRAYLEKLGERE